jgi:hypothetical protein
VPARRSGQCRQSAGWYCSSGRAARVRQARVSIDRRAGGRRGRRRRPLASVGLDILERGGSGAMAARSFFAHARRQRHHRCQSHPRRAAAIRPRPLQDAGCRGEVRSFDWPGGGRWPLQERRRMRGEGGEMRSCRDGPGNGRLLPARAARSPHPVAAAIRTSLLKVRDDSSGRVLPAAPIAEPRVDLIPREEAASLGDMALPDLPQPPPQRGAGVKRAVVFDERGLLQPFSHSPAPFLSRDSSMASAILPDFIRSILWRQGRRLQDCA